jgi:DNA-binding NarL/FixJ family response regulator
MSKVNMAGIVAGDPAYAPRAKGIGAGPHNLRVASLRFAVPMKKALLVDDHAFLRDALSMRMAQELPFLTLLQAGSLAQARQLLQDHADVQLVLLDLTLPDGHGLDLLPQLRAATGATLVVMSADDSSETILAAIQAGAAGYIPKTLESAHMLEALRVVMAGGVYLPPKLLAGAGSNAPGMAAPRARDPADLGLSPRQGDVLRMLIEGKPNKLISRELEMSESTVKTHLAAIFRKLDANSRTQAVVAAARLGLRLVPEGA